MFVRKLIFVAGQSAMLLLLPGVAIAHAIPPIVVGLALSPLLALLLACVYGIIAGRWKVLVVHLILISLWVIIFGLAANFVSSDFIIWSPIVAMMIHIAVLIGLIGWRVVRRIRAAE